MLRVSFYIKQVCGLIYTYLFRRRKKCVYKEIMVCVAKAIFLRDDVSNYRAFKLLALQ